MERFTSTEGMGEGGGNLLVVDDKLNCDAGTPRPPGVGGPLAVPHEVAGVAGRRGAEAALGLVVLGIVDVFHVGRERHFHENPRFLC